MKATISVIYFFTYASYYLLKLLLGLENGKEKI